jgi:hypothetical protein
MLAGLARVVSKAKRAETSKLCFGRFEGLGRGLPQSTELESGFSYCLFSKDVRPARWNLSQTLDESIRLATRQRSFQPIKPVEVARACLCDDGGRLPEAQ